MRRVHRNYPIEQLPVDPWKVAMNRSALAEALSKALPEGHGTVDPEPVHETVLDDVADGGSPSDLVSKGHANRDEHCDTSESGNYPS